MPVVIGVPVSADPNERRTPITPEVTAKLQALGADVVIERGATKGANLREEDFPAASWADSTAEVLNAADVIWTVGPPHHDTLASMQPGTVLMGTLAPYGDAERVRLMLERQLTSFSLELLPRISRAQAMDVLTSQATVAGYQGAVIAAARSPKFFPMLTYAAGTIRPARVLVIGAGVAGLQAIATAKRLGAVVEGYDVRPETREQVESLGAKFVETGVSAVGEGGYARDLTEDELERQASHLADAVARCDVLITTAAVPGRTAPVIVDASMVAGMRPGAVVVDLAAESGGNVAGTVAGREVRIGPAHVVGPVNLPSRLPVHASEMFSRNLLSFITPMLTEGLLHLDFTDEVIAGSTLTHAGELRHQGVKAALGL